MTLILSHFIFQNDKLEVIKYLSDLDFVYLGTAITQQNIITDNNRRLIQVGNVIMF